MNFLRSAGLTLINPPGLAPGVLTGERPKTDSCDRKDGLLGSGIVIRQGAGILQSVGDLPVESMVSGAKVKSDISPHDSTDRYLTCSMTGTKYCGMVANMEVETLHLLD